MTSGGLAESPVAPEESDPISGSEVGNGALPVVGLLRGTCSRVKALRPSNRQRNGLGKAADEEDREERRDQMSKGGEVDQFHE